MDFNFCFIVILWGYWIIILRGKIIFRRGDYVYFIIKKKNMEKFNNLIGKQKYKVKNVMIFGGIFLGLAIVKQLENEYNIMVIESDKECCKVLAEQFNNSFIINGDVSNIDFLVEEGLNNMDVFVVLSSNFEINIIVSFIVKNYGVYKIIVQVENKEYIYIF